MDEAKDRTVVPSPPEALASPQPPPQPDFEEAQSLVESPAEAEPANAWLKVRKLALRQLDRFMSLEPKVLRGDDPDAIHDLRVASRRLQQILDLLYPAPRPGEIRKLRRKIQRCRRVLGEVRNCDVQLQRVERTLASKRTARREGWEAVHHYLHQRRSEHFEKAVRKLGKVNLAVFYVQLKEHLTPSLVVSSVVREDERPIELGAEQFYERVGAGLERVWRGMETQVAQSHRDPSAAVIHSVRIAAKRVRYLIEVIREFNVPGAAKALTRLRTLQQLLGDWHDLEVMEQMMIEMLARPQFLRNHMEIALSVERLILRLRLRKEMHKQKYFAMTRDSEGYQQIKEWVTKFLASPAKAFRIAD
jgi:CHAD domain-containing protein